MSATPSMYQAQNALAVRRAECERLQAKYPEMLPLALERAGAAGDKVHFAALPRGATVADVDAAVRDAAGIVNKSAHVSLAVAGCAPSAAATVGDLYDHCKDADGFLYVSYSLEQTMGNTFFRMPCLTHYNDGC